MTTTTGNARSTARGLGKALRLVAVGVVAAFVSAGLSVAPAHADAAPAPSSGATAATARGDVVFVRGVPVRNVTVSKHGRLVSARVLWNQVMLAREGNRDRFNIRLVAFPNGGGAPVVLFNSSKAKTKADVQRVTIKLSKRQARVLRNAADAVLTVSQQYAAPKSKTFGRNYVTVTHLNLTASKGRAGFVGVLSAAPGTRALRDCSKTLIKPRAGLGNCDLAGANLSNANLSGINFSGAILTGTDLSGANLSGADLAGVVSGGIAGIPAQLPAGWALVNGFFVPVTPTVLLTCANSGGAANSCVVGDTGPGGGKVFYVNNGAAGGSRYMEAAAAATVPAWTAPDPPLEWGVNVDGTNCTNLDIPGAAGIAVGAGSANTTAITVACTVLQAPAAWAAKNYTGGGVSWFLPSQDELNELYRQRGGVGGFAADYYWSSSQLNANVAWYQYFDDGVQRFDVKGTTLRVRPVRAF